VIAGLPLPRIALFLPALALLAACSAKKSDETPTSRAQAAGDAVADSINDEPAQPASPGNAPARAGQSRKVKETGPLYDFEYAYPAEAGAIPSLKAWLDADLKKQREDLIAEAKDGKADAKTNDYPFNGYSSGLTWSRVADLPGWLSLSGLTYEFTGGAHPNHGYTALLWDKAANRRRAATDLFLSKAAFSAAIREVFCDALDRQRETKRGEKVNRASGDEFDACLDPAESTVILGSSNHQTFDRLGVLIGPYEAGPYAEGDYEVSLPVTQAVLDAVKPEYKAAFSLRK
jgi:hypothetical protein